VVSILTSIKKLLGLDESYTQFDPDIIMHINSVFMTLTQLGIGPTTGFVVTDAEDIWKDFIGTTLNLEAIKTYVYLKVRLMFDPPQLGYLVDSINTQCTEMEWRLTNQAEGGT
jgi:hypothetical protein